MEPVIIDDLFRVHPDGSIDRKRGDKWIPATKSFFKDHNGKPTYQAVTALGSDKKRILRYAHRLYAEAFIDNPDPETHTFVRARNGDYTDLTADNLYWTDGNGNIKNALQARTDRERHCDRCGALHQSRKRTICTKCQITEYNENLKVARKKQRHQKIVDELNHIDMGALTPTQRKYITLRKTGMTQKQIADHFGVYQQAVQLTIARALDNREHRTQTKRKNLHRR